MAHERPRLDAVLLDAGGTLIRLDFEWMTELLGTLGVKTSPGALRRAEIDGRRRYDAFRAAVGLGPATGRDHGRAYFGGMLEAIGMGAERVQLALEQFLERQEGPGLWVHPMEQAREALDGLARLGLRRAVVSNSDGRAEQHLRDCGLNDGFEVIIDSHHVGVEKPDPRIFHLALEHMKVPADRALYVGDLRAVDEAGARAAGLHAVLIDPFSNYAEDGVPRIEGIGGLADWIGEHFTIAAPLKD